MERRFGIKSFLLAFFAVIFLAALMLPSKGGLRERYRRAVCEANMRKVGMVLAAYAKDNAGFTPPGDMFSAAKTLRKLDYLNKDTLCRLSLKATRATEDIPLVPEMLPYVYYGDGMNLKNATRDIPLLCDTPGRHKDFIHVLFADGHLEGFSDKEWVAKCKDRGKSSPPR